MSIDLDTTTSNSEKNTRKASS